MPVGTERRILGVFKVPFVTTFEPLRKSVQVLPTLRETTDEHVEGVGEIPSRVEAWAHPIVVAGRPEAVLIEQRRRIPGSGYTDTKPEYGLTLKGNKINTFRPLKLRISKRNANLLLSFVAPRIIVYQP